METITFERVVPILRIFDLAKADEFYVGYLGFQVDWNHRFDAPVGAPTWLLVSKPSDHRKRIATTLLTDSRITGRYFPDASPMLVQQAFWRRSGPATQAPSHPGSLPYLPSSSR